MGQRRRSSRWILGVLVFAFVLFFLFPKTRNRPLSLIEAPFVWLAATLTEVADGMVTGMGDAWHNYVDLHDARVTNRELMAERDVLITQLAEREAGVRRAERLEALLVLKQEAPSHTVSARVIGGDAARWFHSLLIDRGSLDGIRVGDGVIAAQGVVGRIAMVTHNTAQVLVVNNRGCVVPVRLARNRQAGILKGGPRPIRLPDGAPELPMNPASLAEVKYIPRSADMAVGDRVVTSGLEGHFPSGMPVGTVSAIVRVRTEIFAKVYVVPETAFATLEEVLVVTRKATEDGG